jgi:hypothetical protein
MFETNEVDAVRLRATWPLRQALRSSGMARVASCQGPPVAASKATICMIHASPLRGAVSL